MKNGINNGEDKKGCDINYLSQFEAYLLTEKRVAENTFLAYMRDIRQLQQFLTNIRLTIVSCQYAHLRSFLKHLRSLNISARSLSRKISSLKMLYTFLHTRYNFPNIANSLAFPSVERRLPNYLTEQEVQQLLSAADVDISLRGIRNKVMVYLLYASGVRVSELVSFTIEQLHFDSGFVNVVGKGKKERIIPLPKPIFDLLRDYLDNVYPKLLPKNLSQKNKINYLFFSVQKDKIKPMSRQYFWHVLKKILAAAGVMKNVTPHSLRHSLVTHMLKNGADIRFLQILLGHENLSTVQIYTHLTNPQLREIYDKKHPRA